MADDCALSAHSLDDIQVIVDRFADAVKNFGLTMNLKKTDVLFQSCPKDIHCDHEITIHYTKLTSVKVLCYLGSIMSYNACRHDDITNCLSKASVAFACLNKILWKSHDIKLSAKISVYRTAVLSSMMYGYKTWTPYRKHVRKLEACHMRCLRKICNIRWQDRMANATVLEMCEP